MDHGVVGIDLGGTNIRLGVVDEEGEISFFQKTKRAEFLNDTGEGNAGSLIDFISDYAKKVQETYDVPAVCIGLPATLNRERDTLIQAPNIRGLDGVPFKKMLEDRLNIKVFLERDVNLLFFNDMKKLDIPEKGINVGIYIGTGIGNSIFINGEPLAGKDGVAGELGHIPFGRSDAECGCGNRGCAESIVAGKYLAALHRDRFSEVPIDEVFTDERLREEVEAFVDGLARVAASEINILNPDTIVLGGGVLAMKGFPKEELKKRIYEHARKPFPADSLDIRFSEESDENGVRGAAAFGFEKIRES